MAQSSCERLIDSVKEEGICGIMEHDVLELIQKLHEADSSSSMQSNLIACLDNSAEELITMDRAPTFAALMVLVQLSKDLKGPAAPPTDCSLMPQWKILESKLKAALACSLSVYPIPGSKEAKDLTVSLGALSMMLFSKIKEMEEPYLQLACEAAMLRLIKLKPKRIQLLASLEGLMLNGLKEMIADADPNAGVEGIDDEDDEEGSLSEEDELSGDVEEEEEEEEEEETAPPAKRSKPSLNGKAKKK